MQAELIYPGISPTTQRDLPPPKCSLRASLKSHLAQAIIRRRKARFFLVATVCLFAASSVAILSLAAWPSVLARGGGMLLITITALGGVQLTISVQHFADRFWFNLPVFVREGAVTAGCALLVIGLVVVGSEEASGANTAALNESAACRPAAASLRLAIFDAWWERGLFFAFFLKVFLGIHLRTPWVHNVGRAVVLQASLVALACSVHVREHEALDPEWGEVHASFALFTVLTALALDATGSLLPLYFVEMNSRLDFELIAKSTEGHVIKSQRMSAMENQLRDAMGENAKLQKNFKSAQAVVDAVMFEEDRRLEEHALQYSDLKLVRKPVLGEGAFGSVLSGTLRLRPGYSTIEVAVKCVRSTKVTRQTIREFLKEIE